MRKFTYTSIFGLSVCLLFMNYAFLEDVLLVDGKSLNIV